MRWSDTPSCAATRLRAAQCRRQSPEKEKSHKKQNPPQPNRIMGNRYYEQDVYYLGMGQLVYAFLLWKLCSGSERMTTKQLDTCMIATGGAMGRSPSCPKKPLP